MDGVEDLLCVDKQDDFISFIKRKLEDEELGNSKVKISAHELLLQICDHSAVECATTLLKGETGLHVDLNRAFQNGLYPLHYVAQKPSSALVHLFLEHGARTDICCEVEESKHSGMVPLEVAIKGVAQHAYLSDWTVDKSFYKLIYILCLPGLAEHLDCVKLLASSTEDDAVHRIISQIAKEGRLVELAVLLLVAHGKLTTPVILESVQETIRGQLQLLMDWEFKLMDFTSKSPDLILVQQKKVFMVAAFQIFKLLEIAGEIIEDYRCRRSKNIKLNYLVGKELEDILKELGVNFTEDETDFEDISCLKLGLRQEEFENLRTATQNQFCAKSSLFNPLQKRLDSLHTPHLSFTIRGGFHGCPMLKDRLVTKTFAPIKCPVNGEFLCRTTLTTIGFYAKRLVRYL